MTDKEIEAVYQIIQEYHEKYLKKHDVTLPRLRDGKGNYIKDALVLVYLARFYPSTVSVMKEELTEFIRKFYPKITDVQQAKQLGMQKGWFIAAGGRDDIQMRKRGEYRLITLERPYPHFKGHRIEATGDWDAVNSNMEIAALPAAPKKERKIFTIRTP